MLTRLSIRDIVLIDRLDIDFAPGLAVLTGETGAGKSILLDAFALSLGGRGDAKLVRQGAELGQVTAAFELPPDHVAHAIMAANDISAEDDLILRRVQFADGRTRAFVNDQPVSAQALGALGRSLVEIHGQHHERALLEGGTHRALVDAFGGLEAQAKEVARLWQQWRAQEDDLLAQRAQIERSRREADFLRHAADELKRLAPVAAEETLLAEKRAMMIQAEKLAGDLRDAYDAVAGTGSPVVALSAAARRLERRELRLRE
jgi:DNA repair protein RecN (Recombination protein N)